MKITTSILLVSAIVFFSSCSKMPVYKSNAYTQSNQDLSGQHTLNYDKKSNVNFAVSHDENDFYLEAIFYDAKSYQKIMRGGLNVYFDPSAKKKKHYQLKIERSEKQPNKSSMSREMQTNAGRSRNNLPAIIDATLLKVTWDKDGDEFVFYRNLIKDPIRVELGPNEQNNLVLAVKIPMKELPLAAGQNLFSLGIETGSVSSPGMGGQRPGGGMSGGKGGGGRGHGGGGGGMKGGGGMHGGGMQGGTPSGMDPLRLWFQVEL